MSRPRRATRREILAGLAAVAAGAGPRGGEEPVTEPWAAWWQTVCDDLAAGAAPGCACRVVHRGRTEIEAIWGRAQVEPEPVALEAGMWWDLASLTKPIGTCTSIMALWQDGRLDLDAPVVEHLPELLEWGGEEKRAVTARGLLTHSAGLPAWVRFYRAGPGRAQAREALFRTPLDSPPGTKVVYSDLGFMTLGFVVEAVSGQRQDAYLRERVLAAAGLDDRLDYGPKEPARCVATERCSVRERVIRGEVHDENAWACDGVAGHAGLFGTLDGVATFGAKLLAGEILAETTLAEIFRVRDDVARDAFWLSWTRHDYGLNEATAFGHTGFTGTLFWCSRREDLQLTLLTNRVHPSRANGALGEARPRWVRAAAEIAAARG